MGALSEANNQKWHTDRQVLLGDSCHAILPFLAQGRLWRLKMLRSWLIVSQKDRIIKGFFILPKAKREKSEVGSVYV